MTAPAPDNIWNAALSAYPQGKFYVECPHCEGRTAVVPVRQLMRKYGRDKSIGDVARRFKCKQCRLEAKCVYLNEERKRIAEDPRRWKIALVQNRKPLKPGLR